MARVTQPTIDDQKELNDIIEDAPAVVTLRNKQVKIHWLKAGTLRKITDIEMRIPANDENASKEEIFHNRGLELQRNTKKVAAILLNDYWKIKLFWGLKWTWMYYVKQYSERELMPILVEAKKKVDVQAMEYYGATIFSTAMTDTMMAMTKTEAERFRQEQLGAQRTQ